MTEQRIKRTPIKLGNGIHRAKKVDHKTHTRELKHKKKWIEQKLDNK